MSKVEGRRLMMAVMEDPEDTVARLVLADWIEEHSDGPDHPDSVYARFIRDTPVPLHCRPMTPYVVNEKQQIPRDAAPQFLRTHPGYSFLWTCSALCDTNLKIRYGFIEGVVMPWQTFLRVARKLFNCHPVQRVELQFTNRHIGGPVFDPAGALDDLGLLGQSGYRWSLEWWAQNMSAGGDASLVMDAVSLRSWILDNNPSSGYATREEAWEDLSRLCILWGKGFRQE